MNAPDADHCGNETAPKSALALCGPDEPAPTGRESINPEPGCQQRERFAGPVKPAAVQVEAPPKVEPALHVNLDRPRPGRRKRASRDRLTREPGPRRGGAQPAWRMAEHPHPTAERAPGRLEDSNGEDLFHFSSAKEEWETSREAAGLTRLEMRLPVPPRSGGTDVPAAQPGREHVKTGGDK
jgi:hypothetical protein